MTKAESKVIHTVLKRAYDSIQECAMRNRGAKTVSEARMDDELLSIGSDVYLVLSMASEELST